MLAAVSSATKNTLVTDADEIPQKIEGLVGVGDEGASWHMKRPLDLMLPFTIYPPFLNIAKRRTAQSLLGLGPPVVSYNSNRNFKCS